MSDSSRKFRLNLLRNTPKTAISSGLKLMNGSAKSLNAHNAKARVLFLETCKQSQKWDDLSFSNFLPERLLLAGTPVEKNLCALCENPDILQRELTSIAFDRENSDRIRKIMERVLGPNIVEKYEAVTYETYVNMSNTTLNQRGKFRVFSVYAIDINPNDVSEKENLLIVFLLDPFHLVCPVAFKGTDKWDIMRNEYQRVKNNRESIDDAFRKEFKKIRFEEASIL